MKQVDFSFNSNWFDYSRLTKRPGRLRSQVSIPTGSITVKQRRHLYFYAAVVSIPTGSITVSNRRRGHNINGGFNSNWFDYSLRPVANFFCDRVVSIPTGSITVRRCMRLMISARSFNSNWFDYSFRVSNA